MPKDYILFEKISQRGKELAELHMLKEDSLKKLDNSLKAIFPISGSNIIKTIRYRKNDRIIVNDKQHFGNIPKKVWNFRIGGYQVLKQWLNRRRRTKIDNEGIKHFSMIVAILKETLVFMQEINPYYEKVEENLLEKERFGISLDDFIDSQE